MAGSERAISVISTPTGSADHRSTKEQCELENGKYVAPVPLEEDLKLSPYIANAMIYGASKAGPALEALYPSGAECERASPRFRTS